LWKLVSSLVELIEEGMVWAGVLGVERRSSPSLEEVLELEEDEELDEEELDSESGGDVWELLCAGPLAGPEEWYWSVVSIGWDGDDVSMARRLESVTWSMVGRVGGKYSVTSAIGFSRLCGGGLASWAGLPRV
jgi:hypothetical protein